jgi:hypothetical protein
MPSVKNSARRHTAAGGRLIGALREGQAMEFARRFRQMRETLG